MRHAVKQAMMRAGVVLFSCAFAGMAGAAPDYVTAWPRQVPIEAPDPVLGDKPFWEHWAYSEAFSKRFKGFPIEYADPELKSGLQAIALRIFKRNLWEGINSNYPMQYACEVDIYFDSDIRIPLSSKKRDLAKQYHAVIPPSYSRLHPYDDNDHAEIDHSQPAITYQQRSPVLFSVPLDGRFATFGIREYRHNIVPLLSVAVLTQGAAQSGCMVTAPLHNGGAHWLSLFGERLWDNREGGPPKAVYGQYDRNVSLSFDPGPAPEVNGYLRVPKAFNEVALPKAALIKVLNWCVHKRHAHANPKGKPIPKEYWEPIASRCNEAEQYGNILPDPQYHFGEETLQDTGY